jgi:hypothetical protein
MMTSLNELDTFSVYKTPNAGTNNGDVITELELLGGVYEDVITELELLGGVYEDVIPELELLGGVYEDVIPELELLVSL